MRLIDANSLIDRASEYALSSDEYERFCKIIESEPTAYDADAVVEQLENVPIHFSEGHWGEYIDRDDVLIIAKAGGAE